LTTSKNRFGMVDQSMESRMPPESNVHPFTETVDGSVSSFDEYIYRREN
ncbi:MAG: hypothetical protein ACI8XW_002689, partial [Gammaproteobacteria bacterium]